MTSTTILPPREYQDDDERRLADAIEGFAARILTAVDSACRLRTAPNDAKRQRALMRTKLEEAAQAGMAAYAYAARGQEAGR